MRMTLRLEGAVPALFVALWSTGFIGAKLGLPHAGPATFLSLRFLVVMIGMGVMSLVLRARWPGRWREAGHIAVVGFLLQCLYLGGVFIGISKGVSAGLSALIVALQPVLTAMLARRALGERVTSVQWLGFGLGFIGVVLVAASKLSLDPRQLTGLAFTVAALLGITAGTLYQKRFCAGMDLCSGTVIQNAAAFLPLSIVAFLFEPLTIDWAPAFIFALAWLCLVLSVGATMMLLWLLRRGAATRVASLFYLVPPVTALIAYAMFGETLSSSALLGTAIAVLGVALVVRHQARSG